MMADYIEIWGEYSHEEKTYNIGIKYYGDAPKLPNSIRLRGIWTVAALRYCMEQVVNYCVNNKINICYVAELVVVD